MLDQMDGNCVLDWARIRDEYEAGGASARELGRKYGVSHAAINKRVKAERWVRVSSAGFQPPVETKVETKAADDDDDFAWEPENAAVICPAMRSIAVYTNAWGQAVLPQERADYYDHDEDQYVFIDKRDIPALVAKLKEIYES
jgi:hypothetical protein